MSNYMSRGVVACGKAVPSTAGVEAAFGGLTYDYLIYGIDLVVITQGAESASALKLQNFAGSTDYAAVTIGTAAAGSTLEDDVELANKQRTAGDECRVLSVTNDSTLVYFWRVFGSSAFYG